MSASNSLASYADIRSIADRALESEKGIRITLADSGQAVHFRQRFYKFRALDRRETTKIYPKGDPAHGVSAYDSLKATASEQFVLIQPVSANSLVVEDL